MTLPDWPSGHRHVHHGFDAERAQREQALVYRDHHEEDHHTLDGHYAAVDEAFTRLSALERPTTEARLAILRKKAAARVIQRQYNREANWLVHHGQHLHYGHYLMLHGRYPDRHNHPSKDGLALSDEDKLRIGPNQEDLWQECWQRVADLAPATPSVDDVPAWLVPHYTQARVSAGFTSAQIVNFAEAQRRRARLLAAMPRPSDSAVRDDYFEPTYWSEGHAGARDYARLAALGDTETDWHTLARQGFGLSVEDDDLIALAGLLREAEKMEVAFPIWENPPADLPEIRVNTSGKRVVVSWPGTLPTGTQVVVSVAVAKGLRYLEHRTAQGSSSPFNVTVRNEGRAAILVQHERSANINQTDARTLGEVKWVGTLS